MLQKYKIQLIILAATLAVLAAIVAGMGTFYTEYLWFESLGFSKVFTTVLFSQIGIGVAFGLVALAALAVHIVLIKRFSKPRTDWSIPTATGEVIDLKEIVGKVSTPVIVCAAMVIAAGLGYLASRNWEAVLKLLNQTPFGKTEPILGQDIGFYLFVLPTLQFAQEWLVYLTGFCLVMSAVVYFLRNAIVPKDKYLEMSTAVQGHLYFALATIMLVLAWGWRIEMFELLFSKRGVAYGATYTDVHANLIAYRIMIGICCACAAFLVYLIFARPQGKRATLMPAIGLGTVVAFYLVGTFAWPTVVQQFVVTPNELDKENPYLVHAIEGTRAAYGLDRIVSKEFPALDNLTLDALERNTTTIENIKIWDHRPLRATYKQLQVIRLYYDFPSIGVDRYHLGDDRYLQVMLSARELEVSQLPVQSQTWVNRHLKFTHGYGVCLSPVKMVGKEGLPLLWIKDIPPESEYPQMKITQPEIYYGQATNDFALVNTNTQEFDYPKGNENIYTTYQGQGGVPIGGFFRRLLFAIRMSDKDLLFTSYLNQDSRILFNRLIQDRVEAVAPFLMLDQEPYLTVVNGRLLWIQDAYTISYRYPYSQPTQLGRRARINYIRNSVKVVIDAYHGKMDFYIWDPADPMVQTYAKIFPALFKPASAMPAELRAHVRYPKDLFMVQASMYESFHMTDPQVFYNQEDKWNVANELSQKTIGRQQDQTATRGISAQQVTEGNRMSPYYMIMKLPENKKEEFLLMIPFTPKDKDNMVAWMSARCDGDNYGKLLVYTFPKQKMIFGPMQIEARIDQDEMISQWITLRNQQGSTVIRGDILVIPIEDSILYVEPIYLESTQTQLPELKQVIVAYGKRLTMKGNLRDALNEVFIGTGKPLADKLPLTDTDKDQGATQPTTTGSDMPPVQIVASEAAQKLVGQALSHYKSGQRQVADGDWAGYGKQQQELERVLNQLAKILEGKFKPATKQPAGGASLESKPATEPRPNPQARQAAE